MSKRSTLPSVEATDLTLHLLEELFSGDGAHQVGVRLWDGTRWPDESSRPATLVLKHPGALRAMLLPGTELALAEAYLYDDFDVEGDIESVFGLADALAEVTSGWRKKLRDVESMREHYALTLRHWVRRLEAHHDEALKFVDEPTYRVWRLFTSGSAHGFTTGRLNVYQALLVKPDECGQSGLPLTRKDWYTGSE